MQSDTDVSDYECSSKRNKFSITNVPVLSTTDNEEPEEQSVWGQSVPYSVLQCIFHKLCIQEGCLPLLVR